MVTWQFLHPGVGHLKLYKTNFIVCRTWGPFGKFSCPHVLLPSTAVDNRFGD